MGDKQFNLSDIFRAIRRRKLPALIGFLVVFGAFLAYALFAPATYRSNATILIEQQEIPQDLVRSTVTSFADQRIQVITQKVMTFSRLSEIIKKYDLYQKLRKKEPLEYVVEEMKDDINQQTISASVVDPRSGVPREATIAFSISYVSHDPQTAQSVANELTNLYLNENLKTRADMAREAEDFLTAEVEALEKKASELDLRLAEFKEKNFKRLPELSNLNFSMLDRAESEYMDLSRQIQTQEERRVYLESQLSQQSPNALSVTDTKEGSLSPQARAKLLQNRYIELSATYSETHPDVIKARRELEKLAGDASIALDASFLRKQLNLYRADLQIKQSKYGAQHPDVLQLQKKIAGFEQQLAIASNSKSEVSAEGADNPAYVQLSAMLESSNVELQNLRQTRERVKKKISDLEAALTESPAVEKEYKELSRNYDNTQLKYRELKAKQLEAQMARTLENERKGERFTLIEPPLLPEKPIKPNRTLIALMGLVVAMVFGAGCIVLLENMDQTFRSDDDIKAYFGVGPLAVVPHITTLQERVSLRRTRRILAVSAAVVIAVLVVLMHVLVMPIDVLWFVALRKIA